MKPIQRLVYTIVIASLLLLGVQGTAFAQTNNPVGQWQVSSFDDATANLNPLAVQTLCFRANGTWFGSFAGWRGSWFQKGANVGGNGNRVRIVGNFVSGANMGAGNDSAEFDFISSNLMTGPWSEWLDLASNGSGTGLWMRMSATRTSGTCTITPIPPATLVSGDVTGEDMPFGRSPDADEYYDPNR